MRPVIRSITKKNDSQLDSGHGLLGYRPPAWAKPVAIVGASVLTLVLITIFYWMAHYQAETNTELTVVQNELRAIATQLDAPTETPWPTSTPEDCRSAGAWLEIVLGQLNAAQYKMVAENTRTALLADDICVQYRQRLAELAVTADIENLFSEPFVPENVAMQQELVDRYNGLERFAVEHGVDVPTPRQMAQRAYDVGQFRLAATLFEQAVRDGEVSTHDQKQVQFYFSTLYNLGYWLTEVASGTEYTEGLRILVMANMVDRTYKVGSGKAWGRLVELLGADESIWPEPVPSPLFSPATATGRRETIPSKGMIE